MHPFADGTVRMLVNSVGFVGINTTSPTARLHTVGGFRFDDINTPNGTQASLFSQGIHPDGRWGLRYTNTNYAAPFNFVAFREGAEAWGNGSALTNISFNGNPAPLITSAQGVHAHTYIVGQGNGPENQSRLELSVSSAANSPTSEFLTAGAYPNLLNYYRMETKLTGIFAGNTTVKRAPLRVSARELYFYTGHGNGQINSTEDDEERLRISELGNVGIGTAAPAERLHVAGNIRASSLVGTGARLVASDANGTLQNFAAGNNGEVLTMVAGAPAWAAPVANSWALTGNAGTNPAVNFVGTTDDVALNFRVNNQRAGRIDNSAGSNTFLGYLAGNANIGGNNAALGTRALSTNTVGGNNSAVGNNSLSANVSGSGNSAFGYNSLAANTTGNNNTAVGGEALRNSTFAERNVAVGHRSLFNTTTGSTNVGVGFFALNANTTGADNVALGANALLSNTTSSENTAVGNQALRNNTAARNTAVGANALQSNTTGSANEALGFNALFANTTGSGNSAMGSSALQNNTTGMQNVAIGQNTMNQNATGSYNIAVGALALQLNTIGDNNVAIGLAAMQNTTAAYNNVAVGQSAMRNNTTGTDNTAVGFRALENNQTGSQNIAIGRVSLFQNATGIDNIAVGNGSLEFNNGTRNSACGHMSLNANTTGINNSAFGYQSLLNNQTGRNNTAVGISADVTAPALDNASVFGANAAVNASNKIRLGDVNVAEVETQFAYTTVSDKRFKYNVADDVHGLDFITRLRPVTYQFDTRKFDQHLHADDKNYNAEQKDYSASSQIRRTGFLAQDVAAVCEEIGYDFDGIHKPQGEKGNYSVAYAQFVMPLVKAVQELHAENQSLRRELDQMRQEMKEIRKMVESK